MSDVTLDLKGVQPHINYNNVSNMLEANFKMYYEWAFLRIGAWTEVGIPSSGYYGGDFSRLRAVSDPNYNDGEVWETARKDLVWESGINYENQTGGIQNPEPVGYPVVNGSTTTTGYYINYPLGQIVFDSAVTGPVYLPHSYRNIQIYRSDEAPWLKEIQYQSYRPDNEQFLQSESGAWSIFSQNRVQLPAVVIEVVPRGGSKGWELGGSLKHAREIQFSILTDNPWDRKNLMDIISAQVDRSLPVFNINTAINEFPLDYRGMLTGDKTYPYFVNNTGTHRLGVCEIDKSSIVDIGQIHPGLFISVVRTTTETIA